MKKPISPELHGLLDYTTAATATAASRLLRVSAPAARTAQAWAAGYSTLAAMTDYPLAVKRAVPFRTHGTVDKVLGVLLPAIPWMLGFARDRRGRNLFLGLAAVSIVVTALTDWNAGRDASAA
jgi:hypothetical protein